jgi:pullulanase-type alpha-1,6-glucosidase
MPKRLRFTVHCLLLLTLFLSPLLSTARAQGTAPAKVVIPGTLQSKAGCSGDWQPDCDKTALTYNPDKDVWEGAFLLPAGSYEYKVALNGTWDENYGAEGQRDGSNILLKLEAETKVTFTYDHKTHIVTDSVNGVFNSGVGGPQPTAPQPSLVVIPGTLQSELGCSGDWQPDCAQTALAFDEEDGVWQGAFLIQPNNDQDKKGARYKVALNGSWSENYGQKAQGGGADIPLLVTAPTEVKFYYDHSTHWATDNFNTVIAVAMGNFQSKLGCKQDDDPGCLRSWMQDPDGTGTYAFSTNTLPPGDYEVKVAINESNDNALGQNGQAGGDAIQFTLKAGGELYVAYTPAAGELLVSTDGAPKGSLNQALAHWVSRETIAWNVAKGEGYTYKLIAAPEGGLALTPQGLTGGVTELPLTLTMGGLNARLTLKFPHLASFAALQLAEADLPKVPELLTGQLAVAAYDDAGKLIDSTALQIPGVLDDLYAEAAKPATLGVSWNGATPTLAVWAPTAQKVELLIYPNSAPQAEGEAIPMTLEAESGIWRVTGDATWNNKFYQYMVYVYVPALGRVERNLVTDPYSFSLSTNSLRSQIVDLNDPALMPAGWETVTKPTLAAPEDAVIYELHVRDFSIHDTTVPAEERGTFKAFTQSRSDGMKHLTALAAAGLTHIHLLPAFDIASVDEDKANWLTVDEAALKNLPPDSDEQALAVETLRGQDGYNWGYDPYHYTTPEGSYATNPDGPTRILEFREMVQALNQAGLRVVMDVVYNHTNASGQNDKSVLDKIVPGYYHRLDDQGHVATSTCCQNTATEHALMEKLMIDSVQTWATAYKVDGFRFDLMGHHMLDNMTHLRAALDALTLSNAGVDGKAIYVYGEGWDFGEVAGNARGRNATQLNISGTGLGVFNDRLRDAVRGGGPFDDPQLQGFATGLYFDPNANATADADAQKATLLKYMDWIRVSLAGDLKTYVLLAASGKKTQGAGVSYNGKPTGYTLDPQENIVYVSAHDNETLFDAIQWKAPATTPMADRARMNHLALSFVMFSQGVPFFHAGDDLLRSKSLERDSYNSGDWFNAVDWTHQTNNWGVGLPVNSRDKWDRMKPLLANPALKPAPEDIARSNALFRELLAIRKSSPLFRLPTANDVIERLTFYNVGAEQQPGLIVMALDDRVGAVDLDPHTDLLVVLFNGQPGPATFADPAFAGLKLELHAIQQNSVDAVVKTAQFNSAQGEFVIPSRTAAVYVLKQTSPRVWPTAVPTATTVPPPPAPTQPLPTPRPTQPLPTAAPTAIAIPAPVTIPADTPGTLAIAFALAMMALLVGWIVWSQRNRSK